MYQFYTYFEILYILTEKKTDCICLEERFVRENITWIILLKISSRKNTKWWLVTAEKRNHGVLNASKRCSSFVLATMDKVLRYGETLTRIVSRQSNNGCSLWWPVVIILWNTVTKRSACVPETKRMNSTLTI